MNSVRTILSNLFQAIARVRSAAADGLASLAEHDRSASRRRALRIITNRYVLASLALVLVGMGAAAPFLVRITSTPGFCGSCHVMDDQYEHWFYDGKHRMISCVDCHLPNNNIVNHLVWKGIDGMKDVFFFYTRLTPEIIRASSHARRTIRANCVRCHDEMVSRVSIDTMQCWDCHRARNHQVVTQ